MTTPYLIPDVRSDEGTVLRAYQDAGGVWTCGCGATGWDVRRGVTWTLTQCMTRLASDIAKAVADLDRHLPWWRKLSDPRQDVLVQMTFNLGIEGVLAFHHTLAAVQSGEYTAAAADMLTTQPWHRQIGARCDRLAAQMRTGMRVDRQAVAA